LTGARIVAINPLRPFHHRIDVAAEKERDLTLSPFVTPLGESPETFEHGEGLGRHNGIGVPRPPAIAKRGCYSILRRTNDVRYLEVLDVESRAHVPSELAEGRRFFCEKSIGVWCSRHSRPLFRITAFTFLGPWKSLARILGIMNETLMTGPVDVIGQRIAQPRSDQLRSMAETAQRLGISLPKLKVMARSGDIETVRIGRRRLCAESTIQAFIASLLKRESVR